MQGLAFLSESVVRALLFAMIGFVSAWFLRRRGAEAQNAIWRTVLAAMLALPLLTVILPALPVDSPRILTNKVIIITWSLFDFDLIRNMNVAAAVPTPAVWREFSMPAGRSAERQSGRWVTWPIVLMTIYVSVSVLFLFGVILQVRRGMLIASSAKRVAIPVVDELVYPRADVRESTTVAVRSRLDGEVQSLSSLPTGELGMNLNYDQCWFTNSLIFDNVTG